MMADIATILNELVAGRMVVLVDDEERENEGDLLAAARFVTPETINFMSRYGRGLICLTLTEQHCRRLELPMMTTGNHSAYGTNFTVSIEAAHGVSTGISAHDRAATILAAANPTAIPGDIVSPGHIFPVQAVSGGVLVRAGHTEAGCDLTHMAGLFPAAVICEIMKEDGSMARLPDLEAFAKQHDLKIGTIKSIIEHRLKNERLVTRIYDTKVQTMYGEFNLAAYRDETAGRLHWALYRGEIHPDKPVPVRVIINPTSIDCLRASSAAPWSVPAALEKINAAGAGIVLMLDDGGDDDKKMQRQLGILPNEPPRSGGNLRHYGLGAQILRDLGAGKIILLSSRLRLPSMEGFGLSVEDIIE